MSQETHIIRGTANWAKIIGNPRLNEWTGDKEWSIDLTPNTESLDLIKKLGISDKLRDPKDGDFRKEQFISFRHKEFKADGTKADPIRVVEAVGSQNVPWDNRLIGNGSDVEIKFVVKDYGKGKKKGAYIRAVRVLKLVPYVTEDFAPLSPDDEFFSEQAHSEPEVARLPDGLEPVVDDLNDDFPE